MLARCAAVAVSGATPPPSTRVPPWQNAVPVVVPLFGTVASLAKRAYPERPVQPGIAAQSRVDSDMSDPVIVSSAILPPCPPATAPAAIVGLG
jgi:hypothetical protein